MTAVRVLLALATCISPLAAGICQPGAEIAAPRREYLLVAGFSPASSTGFGTATDRKLLILGGGYNYLCRVVGKTAISYAMSILPVALTIQPKESPTSPRAIYGFATAPVGFTLDFGWTKRLQPYAGMNLGIIASTHPIPYQAPNATGLNFVVTAGAGLRWNLSEHRALRFGYGLFHISNADTTAYNPGLDNNVIYFSYSFRR